MLKKLVSKLLLSIPRKVFLVGGWILGIIWFDFLRIRRQLVIDNLRIAFPDWDRAKLRRTGRQAMATVGQNIVDVFLLPFFNENWLNRFFVIEGFENFVIANKKNKGVFILGSHVGSGDLSIAALNYLGIKVNLISKEFKSAWLNEFWFGVRGQHGTRFIAPRRSSFDILRALKKKEAVIFVLDQFMGPPLGVRTTFFNKETGTAMGLALMASRTGAPVISVHTYIREDGKSVIVFSEEIPWQDQGQRDASIAFMTQKYTDKIEEIVRRHPEQWLWVHRRWKEFRD